MFFKCKKTSFLAVLLFCLSAFILFPQAVQAAACPAGDGDDGAVDGIITISSNTTWAADADNQGDFDCSIYSIQVTNNSVLTLSSFDNGDTDYDNDYGVTINAINVTVDEGSFISANGTGYKGGLSSTDHGKGPGGGLSRSTQDGIGASHAGRGGLSAADSIYGDAFLPNMLGSGGGRGYTPSPREGGNGGGLIRIIASDTITINGTVRSNGGNSGAGGGGSGGSIYLSTVDLAGTGSITATGGSTSKTSNGGGGGRILVEFSNSSSSPKGFGGSINVVGNTGGGNGTAIVRNSTTGDVYIQATQDWRADPDFEGATHNFSNLFVTDGAIFNLLGHYTTGSDGYGFTFNINGLSIEAEASISLVGKGYAGGVNRDAPGMGPGGGAAGGLSSGPGGGYGAAGGDGSSGRAGGSTYGSVSNPVDLGSGGGGGGNPSTPGGAGGGAIKVVSSGNIIINGSINAGGSNSVSGGGGSGGSIDLLGNTISGDGLITANGGNSTNGSGGGGGRIALKYVSNTLSFAPTALGGTGNSINGGDANYSVYGLPYVVDLVQYQADGVTVINTGGANGSTTAILKLTVADADVVATLTPKIEIRELGTVFSDVATHVGDAVSYSGTELSAPVSITGLSDLGEYHWQAQVCDESGICSSWQSYGSNEETELDFSVVLNINPNDPIPVLHDQFYNSSQPGISFNVSDPDSGQLVAYRIQIDNDADFSSPLIDYTSGFGSVVARTFNVGQALAGGTYDIGSFDQELIDGNYYYRIKAIDELYAESVWVEGSGNPDFVIDTIDPSNASTLRMKRNAASSTFYDIGEAVLSNNLSPYFSWAEGSDADSGVRGYCLYMGTDEGANPANSKGLLGTSPQSTTGSNCGFITDQTNIDFATLAYRGETWIDDVDGTYYFIVKTIDEAGNVFSGPNATNVFEFEMDATAPTNVSSISGAGGTFSNITDMYFSWPSSGNLAAEDSGSGLLGFQYSINSLANWRGTESDETLGVDYVPLNQQQPFNLRETDASDIIVGDNVLYFRVVDIAGNYSSVATYRTASLRYGGEAPTFEIGDTITVTPATSTENSFAFSWDSATASGENEIVAYYYMINIVPPSNLATLRGNSSTYIYSENTEVEATSLAGVNRGSNTVYVVAVDDQDNYSPSNYLAANFNLNSELPGSIENLVLSDSSVKAASLWRASLAWDEPSYVGLGSMVYTIQRSNDSLNWQTVGTTTGNAYVDTVPSSATYYWRVGASDKSDDSIASPTFSNADSLLVKGSYISAPSLSSGPSVSSITTKRAKVSWTTNRAADSRLYFGTASKDYAEEGISKSEQVSDHSLWLNNLSAGTKYYYKTEWTDEDGNTGSSNEQSFTTSPAPTVKDVEVTSLGLSQAIINFTVKDAHQVKIYFGETTDFGGVKEIATSTLESNYTVELSSLKDGTKYYYKINAIDSEGEEYEGTILDFSTLPRPQVSGIRIQQVKNSASPSIVVSWESNTEISSIVTYFPAGQEQYALDQIDLELIGGEHQLLIRGLAADTQYNLLVKGRDRLGNEAVSDLQIFTTDVDTRPPMISSLYIEGSTVPLVAGAGQEASAQLIISWDTDEPATSQVEFGEGTGTSFSQKTQEDGNLTYNHLVVISGLSPSKVYHLRVISKDNSGNVAYGVDTTTITPRATDNALNLVLSNLQEVFAFLGGI